MNTNAGRIAARKPSALVKFFHNDKTAAVICCLPFILGFLAFLVVPMLTSLYYSFTRYNILSPPAWIGPDNYLRMIGDTQFWNSLRATFIFAFSSVPLRLVFALLIAMLLLKATKLTGLYRAMYYLPSILGGSLAVAILWGRMFVSDGVFNTILGLFGLNRGFAWLGEVSTAIWVLVLLAVWQFGSSMLIFLASLKQIPEQLYEASSIDGSGKVRQFFQITLPLLTPTIFFNLVMQTINGFLAFTQAFVITQGRPMGTTNFYALYMYRQTFDFNNAGYGSALAWVMLFIIATVTAVLFITKRFWVYEDGIV
jgi:multiple sugar transport system permease protein